MWGALETSEPSKCCLQWLGCEDSIQSDSGIRGCLGSAALSLHNLLVLFPLWLTALWSWSSDHPRVHSGLGSEIKEKKLLHIAVVAESWNSINDSCSELN